MLCRQVHLGLVHPSGSLGPGEGSKAEQQLSKDLRKIAPGVRGTLPGKRSLKHSVKHVGTFHLRRPGLPLKAVGSFQRIRGLVRKGGKWRNCKRKLTFTVNYMPGSPYNHVTVKFELLQNWPLCHTIRKEGSASLSQPGSFRDLCPMALRNP